MASNRASTCAKVAATASIVGSALSALGWIAYFVAFITSAVLYSPFSVGDIVILGFLSAVSLFAMIVYGRYSLIMAGCIADSISMIPRTVVVILFALCQVALTVAVLVELRESVPWQSQHAAAGHHPRMEMRPYWVCMLVSSLWMLLCSVISVCFAAMTAMLAFYHRRRSQYLAIQ